MKAIILAAGYATRLAPLTKDKPKSLLPINNMPILNYICRELELIKAIDIVYVVSNAKFYNNFLEWSSSQNFNLNIKILNDGSTDDNNKLGAIGDIVFTINEMKIDDDLLVIAGDNFFTYNLIDFYNYFIIKNSSCICMQKNNDFNELKRMAIAQLDNNNKIIDFEEKPEHPKSDMAVYATYIYKKDTIPFFNKYLQAGNNPDAPGYFPAWLYKIKDIYGYQFTGECYDIGTIESYAFVNNKFSISSCN